MRILQLLSAFAYSGPAESVLSLCRELRGQGHEVTLGHDTARDGNAHEEGMAAQVLRAGIPVAKDLVLSTRGGPVSWIADCRALQRRFTDVDVVHTHFSHDHALALVARARAKRPVIIRSIHSRRSLQARVGQRALLRRTDGFVVHDHAARDALVALLHPVQRPVAVIRGPVDTQRFSPEARSARAQVFRAAHRLPPSGPLVLMAAIFQRGRGQDVVLEGWPEVRRAVSGALLCFAGLGEEREKLMRHRVATPENGVHFLGYLDADLPDAFVSADVSVLLAVGNDGYGRAMLQSMACGTPVVSAALPEVLEVQRESKAGWLTELSPTALAQSLIGALGDPGREERRARARRWVEAEHVPAGVAAATGRFYSEIMNQS